MPKTRPLAERFWEKVDKRGPDECWPWLGCKEKRSGRGRIGIRSKPKTVDYAYRVSWELANGHPIPPGILACHTCDNPGCVNDRHVFVGTQLDNMADAKAKGRLVRPDVAK